MDWKVNDKCYFRFELCTIYKFSEYGTVTVDDGAAYIGLGKNWKDRIFPPDEKIQTISIIYRGVHKNLHDMKGNLNYPRFIDWLETEWINACKHKDDDELLKSYYERLESFFNAISNIVNETEKQRVFGIKVFR